MFENVPIVLDGINFAKDYKKYSYNKQIVIGKNINDKNILATLQKHSWFLKCGILKLQKFKRNFKFYSKS